MAAYLTSIQEDNQQIVIIETKQLNRVNGELCSGMSNYITISLNPNKKTRSKRFLENKDIANNSTNDPIRMAKWGGEGVETSLGISFDNYLVPPFIFSNLCSP